MRLYEYEAKAIIWKSKTIDMRRVTDYNKAWLKALSIKGLKNFMNREARKVLNRIIPPGYAWYSLGSMQSQPLRIWTCPVLICIPLKDQWKNFGLFLYRAIGG